MLRAHLLKIRASDGYEAFREQETDELATLIQDRIRVLQNPKDCDSAKKLVCTLNKGEVFSACLSRRFLLLWFLRNL